jgi:hypothetical protein
MTSIFEVPFSGIPRAKMYQAAVIPDEFPHERPMLVNQWHPEDQVAYCGGEYAKQSYTSSN